MQTSAPDTKRPAVVAWFLIFVWLLVVEEILLIVWFVYDGWFNQDPKAQEHIGFNRIGAFLLVIPTALTTAAAAIAQAGVRSKSIWVIGIVLLGFATLPCGCAPFSVPIMVFWCFEQNRKYFCGE